MKDKRKRNISPKIMPLKINIRFVESFLRNWEIIYIFTKREVQATYKGSILGIGWSMINPLIMLCIYTLVFSQVLQAKWGGADSQNPIVYGLNIFTGLIIFNIFAESVSKAPRLLINNANFIKKVVFPIEALGVAQVGAALVAAIAGLMILLTTRTIAGYNIDSSSLLIPVIIGPFALICLGTVWVISATSVIIRDIGQMINAAISGLMFLSPVFYAKETLPEQIEWIALINPIAIAIEQVRYILNEGRTVSIWALIIWWGVGIFYCEACFRIMSRLKPRLGDFL